MTIQVSISNGQLEQKMLKAISKMPPTLRPSSKNVFVEQAIKTYIDSLEKDKVEDILNYINNHNRYLRAKNFYRKLKNFLKFKKFVD